MLTEIEGDLFEQDFPAIAHGCNTKGVMGAGVAAQMARRYPGMHQQYEMRCALGTFRLGDVMPWVTGTRKVIYNLATQEQTGPDARLDLIAACTGRMLDYAYQWNIPLIGLPRIGCGIGGLDWPDVKAVLESEAAGRQVQLVVVTLPEPVTR
jgi:O-acetyl-ADP-ribose deacetylase (regulator of RNase III)